MYTMKADGVVFYDPSSNDMALQVLSPKAKFELNKADRLTFVMLPGNVMYDELNKLKTIVTLEQDGEEIFRGRVIETTTDLYNQKEVYCEGELGYLLDSVQRPYEFDGSAKEYFSQLIANHNADVESHKRFTVGQMTALTDSDTVKVESDEYTGTMAEIQSLLLDEFKGYLRIRYAGGVRYLDYVDKFNQSCSQEINFGVNLVDIENTVNTQDVCSVLIPVGKTIKGKITTIAEANGGKDYIESSALIAKYGRIVKTYTFDDVEDPAKLLEFALAHMAKMEAETTLTITAVDMKTAGANVDGIRLGDTVKLVSSPHGLNKEDVCTKIALPLEKPEKAEYTFGLPFETLTDSNASAARKAHGDYCKLHEWIKATDAELTIAKQHISEFGDTISDVRLEMDAVNAEIKLIATQNTISELVERVSRAEIQIDGLNAEINLIATQESITELVERVTNAEILIDGSKALIEMKASKLEVDEIGRRLSQAEIDIDGANAQIALKASKDEMSTMDRRLSQAEINIDGANAAIQLKASQASFEALTARVNQAEIDINGAEASIALKASAEYVNGIERRLSNAEVDIDGLNATIELKASKDDYDGLAKRLTNAEIAIDGANAQIALKASKTELQGLDKRVSNAEIAIDGANSAIALKASKSDVTSLGNRVSSAELRIDGAESAIRAKADLILLDGYVKATDLETETLKVVDGATLASLKTGSFNCSGRATANQVWATGAVISNLTAPNAILNGSDYSAHSHKVTVNSDGTITLGEVATSGGSFKIADTAYYQNGVSAARTAGVNSVSFDTMFGSNGVITARLTNGKEGTLQLTQGTASGTNIPITGNRNTVMTVNATAVYNNGYANAKPTSATRASTYDSANNAYNVTTVVKSADGTNYNFTLTPISANLAYNAGANSVTLSAGSWSSNKKTITASNGKTLTVDATSVYNNGYNAGEAGVTLSASGWASNVNTITASNGKSMTVTRYYSTKTTVSSGDSVFVRYNGAMVNATFLSGGSTLTYISRVDVG